MIADEVFMSMVRHFALVMPIVASPWGRRQPQLSIVVCLFPLQPLPVSAFALFLALPIYGSH